MKERKAYSKLNQFLDLAGIIIIGSLMLSIIIFYAYIYINYYGKPIDEIPTWVLWWLL